MNKCSSSKKKGQCQLFSEFPFYITWSNQTIGVKTLKDESLKTFSMYT